MMLRRALDFEVIGKRRCGRPKMTWRRQVVEQFEEIGLKKEDAINKAKWSKAVNKLLRIIR